MKQVVIIKIIPIAKQHDYDYRCDNSSLKFSQDFSVHFGLDMTYRVVEFYDI
jgi:hypothetical protein